MNLLPHVTARIANTPLMVLPSKLAAIAAALDDRIGIDATALKQLAVVAPPVPAGSRYVGEFEPVDPNDPRAGRKPYRQAGPTAIIPVHGSLVNRSGWLDAFSGITSYETMRHHIALAVADRDVRAILIDVDSPGGEAIGAFETADTVRAAGAIKPVVAVVNGLCASAAYAVASAATRIVVSKSSLVGSIGVVTLHVDHSRRIDKAGLTPTLIFAGDRKVDGHPYAPLDDEVTGELQAEIDRFYALFVDCVAEGRDLAPNDIRATQARVYVGADAIDIGLADQLGTLEAVVAHYQALFPPKRPAILPVRNNLETPKWTA